MCDLFAQKTPISIAPDAKPNSGSNSGRITNRLGDTKLDSLSSRDEIKVELSEETKAKDYKIISYNRDTTIVDSTLTLLKDYRFNYLRKDNIELLAFHNQGQTFNNLAYKYDEVSLFPEIGAKAKQFNFHRIKDINYYHVPTPITELMYRAGLEQGQVLDALIALNITKRHNLSFQYKGLRSLGKYRHSLASHGNLRLTYSYKSKNKKYQLRTHVAAQEINNNENGGLYESSVLLFEANDPEFRDRARLETNFVNASNVLRTNRYYFEHDYHLLTQKDTLTNRELGIKLTHVFNYEKKHYQFDQKVKFANFGEAYKNIIHNKSDFEKLYNQLAVSLKTNAILGDLKLFGEHIKYDYRYNNMVILANNHIIPQSLHDNNVAIGAAWKTKIKSIDLQAKAAVNIVGDLKGNYIKAFASYTKDSLFVAKATIIQNSKAPNFNYILNQSDYKEYNWYNDTFKNEHTRSLLIDFKSDKWINTSLQATQLDNYTFISDTLAGLQPKPKQFAGTVNYIKVKASKALKYKKLTLDNTLMYQTVSNGSSVFRVPTFVTRNSIYYTNSVFKKKPLFLQTGITFKYFSKYFANAYNPVLSEFHIQNAVEIGNYPVFDVFANARVRNMRIFLKAEHVNSFLSPKKYYVSPNYPYRDFVIRFGIVWNFFI
ncbi:MAG: putative porin [Flavobacteriaceae bacterium]